MSGFAGEGDHAMGLELELEELVEQRERARVQGQVDDAQRLGDEITDVQDELVEAAEAASSEPAVPAPVVHDAAQLGIEDEPT
jgi:hypothetical protein